MEVPRKAVAAAIAAGPSLDERKGSTGMDRYRDRINHGEWRSPNIEGACDMLARQRGCR